MIPKIKEYYDRNTPEKYAFLQSKHLERLQLMMLFSVSGRRDETGFHDSQYAQENFYLQYRKDSALAFLDYAQKYPGLYGPDEEEQLYHDALMVELMGAVNIPPHEMLESGKYEMVKRIKEKNFSLPPRLEHFPGVYLEYMNIAHSLDLLRVYPPTSNDAANSKKIIEHLVSSALRYLNKEDLLTEETIKHCIRDTIKIIQFSRIMLDEFGDKTTTQVELDPQKIEKIINDPELTEIIHQFVNDHANREAMRLSIINMLGDKLLSRGNYNYSHKRFNYCHYAGNSNADNNRDIEREVTSSMSMLSALPGPQFSANPVIKKHINEEIIIIENNNLRPKFIPVLFSSANHLTEAHLLLLQEAKQKILTDIPNAVVPKCVVSPVNDVYLWEYKQYPQVKINGISVERSLLNHEQRLMMAEATIADFHSNLPNTELLIEVDPYETKNQSTPRGNQARGYIEHWERLNQLQEEEFIRAEKEGDEPALYILIAGADLANSMRNWVKTEPGMPFLAASRKTDKNPTGELDTSQNFNPPDIYLNKLGYPDWQKFSGFKSGTFSCDTNDPRTGLSSTKLAECNVEALQLMGNNAFAAFLSILNDRAQYAVDSRQQNTAQKTLEYLESIKEKLGDKQAFFDSYEDDFNSDKIIPAQKQNANIGLMQFGFHAAPKIDHKDIVLHLLKEFIHQNCPTMPGNWVPVDPTSKVFLEVGIGKNTNKALASADYHIDYIAATDSFTLWQKENNERIFIIEDPELQLDIITSTFANVPDKTLWKTQMSFLFAQLRNHDKSGDLYTIGKAIGLDPSLKAVDWKLRRPHIRSTWSLSNSDFRLDFKGTTFTGFKKLNKKSSGDINTAIQEFYQCFPKVQETIKTLAKLREEQQQPEISPPFV